MGKASRKRERSVPVFAEVVETVLEAAVIELLAFGWPMPQAVDRVNALWGAYGPGSESPAEFMVPFRAEIERIRAMPPG